MKPDQSCHRILLNPAGFHAGSFRSLLLTGDFFGVKMVYDDVPNRLLPFDYETYKACGTTLWAVVTNCATGKAEYLPVRDMRADINAIRASSSLPYR